MSVFLSYEEKNSDCTASCHLTERQSWKSITVCPRLPCSPGLALHDFQLFPKVKRTLNRNVLVEGIEVAVTAHG